MHNDIPYRNPAVRDLAWAIGSPPILCRSDAAATWPTADWYYSITEKYAPILRQLDSDPSPLVHELEKRTDHRLGRYFECLWQYWLAHNGRFRLLHANLPIRDHQRTLGEFDLLVKDTLSGKTMHWELAVKFYLGMGDSSDAQNWWGPRQRDRLDIKTQHMLNHQCRLHHQAAARTTLKKLGIQIDESWLLLKGRLFYPLGTAAPGPEHACPEHLQGFWTVPSQLAAAFENAQLLTLERHQWLAPLVRVDRKKSANPRVVLASIMDEVKELPRCIAVIQDGIELTRGFVVAEDWGKHHQ